MHGIKWNLLYMCMYYYHLILVGSCIAAGYTSSCCVPSQSNACRGYPEVCFCDQQCHIHGDCCSDINEIGCGYPKGTCKEAGFDSCCDGANRSCLGSLANCFCDMACVLFGDCCDDIHLLTGCEIVPPVMGTSSSLTSTKTSASSYPLSLPTSSSTYPPSPPTFKPTASQGTGWLK